MMIVILSDKMTDEEIRFINKTYSAMNKKMYEQSLDILRDKDEAQESVEKVFFDIVDNIEEIILLSHSKVEAYCMMMLKQEIINLLNKRNEITYTKKTNYFNYEDENYNVGYK